MGKYSAQELQEELKKNKEVVNEESLASVIPPAPLESRRLKTKERKVNSTTAHLITSMEELLLLNPP